MSEQQSTHTSATAQQKHVPEGYPTWNEYWTKEHNEPWRTEPEIDEERKRYLAERRTIAPNIDKGISPLGSITLTRADVEWLLTTHESRGVIGPVWSEEEKDKSESQQRDGLDLRGAKLQDVDLSELPLASVRFGPRKDELPAGLLERPDLEMPQTYAITEQIEAAAAQMQRANLQGAHLERACLTRVNLEEGYLRFAHLEGACLLGSTLERATLAEAHLEDADVRDSNLQGVFAVDAHFERADLRFTRLGGRSIFIGAHFEDADLRTAVFSDGATLSGAWFGSERDGMSRLADVRWSGANMALVRWVQPRRGRPRWTPATGVAMQNEHAGRLLQCGRALRANRQLATELRSQGLNDQADRFAYRAQGFERQVNRLHHRLLRYVGSLLLDLVSGYGYKPMRSLIAYIIIICAFASAYLINAQFAAPHLTWDEALVLSVSAFHGRGFFTSGISLGDTLARLAAGEAIIGLLIEITFIATFTQRFFAR